MGISDTTWIAGLLVVALLVSAVGTFSAMRLSATGFVPGTTQANVQGTAIISMVAYEIDFGAVNQNANDDTSDDSPNPFEVRNDGNVNVNITVGATALWSGTTKVASDYQFKCGDYDSDECPAGSQTSWASMPVSPATAQIIANMSSVTGDNVLESDIKIHVPVDEGAGSKTSAVTFTASEA